MPDLGVPGLDQPLPKNWITLEDDFVLIYGVIQVPTRLAWQMRICFTFFGKCPYFFLHICGKCAYVLHICGICAYVLHICGKCAYVLHICGKCAYVLYFCGNFAYLLHICGKCSYFFTYLPRMLIFVFICLDAFIHRKQ